MSHTRQLPEKIRNHFAEPTIFFLLSKCSTIFLLFSTQAVGDDNEDDKVQMMKPRKAVHDSIDTLMTYLISEKFVV